MIRYSKLFGLLYSRGMKKSDLLEILSSKTIAKLSKGANLNTDVIDKICLYLGCQPSDIMEVVEPIDTPMQGVLIAKKTYKADTDEYGNDVFVEEEITEIYPNSLGLTDSDEEGLTERTTRIIDTANP